ncbi:MAG TPA: hypothetical protein VK629_10570 [Steroidobacteraceae bacterium]|nr:hypothetical protein [Steroidobacteraceae bacterium]
MTLFAPLLISGADARTYLQGQVTVDLDTLTRSNAVLACVNSAQGRVQAVFTLIERAEGIVLLVVPEMAEQLIARLRKYVLRAKVKIEAAPLIVAGVSSEQRAALNEPALPSRAHREIDGRSIVSWLSNDDRYLLIESQAHDSTSQAPRDSMSPEQWLLADVRAGIPHIFPQTHEAFIAQMLNLDALGGISFEKGCYTGQEIVARMHFRGAVKRRMARYATTGVPPLPGARLVFEGTHAGDVVYAAATQSGSEVLAVINLGQANSVIQLEDRPTAGMQPLALPYSVNGT